MPDKQQHAWLEHPAHLSKPIANEPARGWLGLAGPVWPIVLLLWPLLLAALVLANRAGPTSSTLSSPMTVHGPLANSAFQLVTSSTGAGTIAVPSFYPASGANTNIAFDVIPRGAPPDTGHGVTWQDICNRDFIASISVVGQCLHLSAGLAPGKMYVSTQRLNGAPYLPLAFSMFDGDAATHNESFQVNANGTFSELNGVVRKGRVVTEAGPIAVAATDHWIFVKKQIRGETAVNLLASPQQFTEICVKDVTGDAATNPIAITPASGDIDGSPVLVLNTGYASACVIYNGTSWSRISG